MKADENQTVLYHNLADDPEFIKACEQALQDPEMKDKIICILQRAGLIQSSDRQLV